MANIINLATETKQDEIIQNTNVLVNKTDTVSGQISHIDGKIAEVNGNVVRTEGTVNIINNNLGTPTSGASNATGSNAHAKLNYINNTLATINANTAKHVGTYKTGNNIYQTFLDNEKYITKTLLSISGKGTMLHLKNITTRSLSSTGDYKYYPILIYADNVLLYEISTGKTEIPLPINFNSSIVIKGGVNTAVTDISYIYELR